MQGSVVGIKAKIIEIFCSLQGEGKYAGCRQIFVRFAGCNLRCGFCDTPQSQDTMNTLAREYASSELVETIRTLNPRCTQISLTGGEPLAQTTFLREFLPLIKAEEKQVYLETNGTLFKEVAQLLDWIDVVALDFKLPSSTGEPAQWIAHERFLENVRAKDVFVKTVITHRTTHQDMLRAAGSIARIKPDMTLILQPVHGKEEQKAIEQCVSFQGECLRLLNDVRIIPQIHKYMNVR